jgi:hypothetical protein
VRRKGLRILLRQAASDIMLEQSGADVVVSRFSIFLLSIDKAIFLI